MRDLTTMLALPASLIVLLCASSALTNGQRQPHEKYWPEHEERMKRDSEIQQKLVLNAPVGVRKMSEDEGEKFFLDYWQLEGQDAPDPSSAQEPGTEIGRIAQSRGPVLEDDLKQYQNGSVSLPLHPPFPLHADAEQRSGPQNWFFARSLFQRDFQCPSGTSDCSSIGQKNSCCQTGESCVKITDTGLGDVGCCPAGQTCGASISSCDTKNGYTSCPNSPNGGCCIPGYACQDVGCILVGTQTTTTTLPTVTVTGMSTSISSDGTRTVTYVVSAAATPASPSVQTVTTTLIVAPSSTAAQVTTVTQTLVVTPSTSAAPSTTLIVQGPLTCSSGYQSCPATLEGGCCPTDRACGSASCPPSSTTGVAAPPVRPTSDSSTSVPPTATTTTAPSSSVTSTVSYSGCPTGFYMCSAYYMGGCCRVGRNCDTTSCPASESTSVIQTTGLTIIAPNGASSASGDGVVTITSTTTPGAVGTASAAQSQQGNCANGWFSCAAAQGGGCCPSGYVCGASCTATVSGQSDVGKAAPSGAEHAVFLGWAVLLVGLVAGAGMVAL